MIKKVVRDVENPTKDQIRYLKRAERNIRQLARAPRSIADIALREIIIKRRLQLAGRMLSPEYAARIAKAVEAAHRRRISKELKRLYLTNMPAADARTCADGIRAQFKAMGHEIKAGSVTDAFIFNAQLSSGINFTANQAKADIWIASLRAREAICDRTETALREMRLSSRAQPPAPAA